MTGVRVCVSGAHGSGKSYIIDKVLGQLLEEGYHACSLPSPTREVKKLGFQNNLAGDLGMAFLCTAKRLENELAPDLDEYDIVLSDRCLLDEVVYTTLDSMTVEDQETSFSLMVIAGFARQFYREKSRWDVVALKNPHPDFPPETDGDRLPDLGFQRRIAEMLVRSHEGSTDPEKLFVLPLDRDEAANLLLEEVKRVHRERR